MKTINSVDNKLIKTIIQLKKSKERKKQKLFFVDGFRETKIALDNNYLSKYIFFCPILVKNEKEIINLINKFSSKTEIVEVSEKVFKKISYKENPDGILSVFEYVNKKIEDIEKENILIILDSIEKPGNLGAIIRTLVAANLKNIIITGREIDIFNPNVIKASEGLIFLVNIINSDNEELINYLNINKYNKVGTFTDGNKNYSKVNFKEKVAIIMGSEARGLDEKWKKNIDEKIKIPMKEGVDSLNVSVSVAIVLYEALRQNNYNNLN